MAFVKLDCGILNSTLWVEREQRDIFITALLMAAPIELKEPMEQYEVDAIRTTGFVVPPGWYGFVEAAGPGIVRRALADMKQGMEALRKLGEPDEESRSSEFDGRRLVRVSGGYVVLNFMKYREKDNSAAVRSARYRERKKLADAASVTRNATAVTRDSSRRVTIAEAEAEAEAEAPNASSMKGDQGRKSSDAASDAPRKRSANATGTRLPADWALSKELGEWAMQDCGMTREAVKAEAEKFADYWHGVAGAKGRKADWAATWRNWCRNAKPATTTAGRQPMRKADALTAGNVEVIRRYMERAGTNE
jgi:hypothetical protein